MEAGQHALISLLEDFDETRTATSQPGKRGTRDTAAGCLRRHERRSTTSAAAVLRTRESKHVEGGIIASLSIAWGSSMPEDDLGGYHLPWPRDLVEIAGGFVAIGAHEHVRRVLRYLQVTQEADGHWSQHWTLTSGVPRRTWPPATPPSTCMSWTWRQGGCAQGPVLI